MEWNDVGYKNYLRCPKQITKLKSLIKNVIKLHVRQIYVQQVSMFSWIQFLESIKYVWYFQEIEFKKINTANRQIFDIAQFNSWIQEIEFNKFERAMPALMNFYIWG